MLAPVSAGSPYLLAPLFAACMTAACLDLKYRRIPNWLCVVTAFAGLLAVFFVSGLAQAGEHALHMSLALIGGMILFALGVVGGGDAKFYAAVAAWFGMAKGWTLLVLVTSSGLLLLVTLLAYRVVSGRPDTEKGGFETSSLPYGVAIGSGAILAYVL